jgi:outer membrane protein assembly factor BamA
LFEIKWIFLLNENPVSRNTIFFIYLKTIRLQISVLVLVCQCFFATAQNSYTLKINGADSASATTIQSLGLTTSFASKFTCAEYVTKLSSLLQAKGFVTASIDSMRFDSAAAYLLLYTGTPYKWAQIDAAKVPPDILERVNWQQKLFEAKPVNFSEIQSLQDRILTYLENNGYPFAKVFLDSIKLEGDKVFAQLVVDKSSFYKIDSIRSIGTAKISSGFLQKYLDIPNGTVYSKEKIVQAQKKIKELTYAEEEKPAAISFLPTGSSIDFFLKQKKSSQVNLLIGFLPRQDIANPASTKLLITGEANVLLKNALGVGETIGLNWQQLQQKSPRLNFLYNHPFVFNTPLGLDFSFDMFKRDNSFLNINFLLGAGYSISATQSGRVFLQRFQSIVSQEGIDTSLILLTRRLPNVGDVSSFNIGIDYEYNTTDYRLNPRKGNELRLITSIGSKKIKRNDQILDLKDPNDPGYDFGKLYDTIKLSTYQFRARIAAAKYFPLANKRSTVKAGLNAGVFQSASIFRNEMFQIGGYKLLRGFDEESQYLSAFAVATAEFRYLVGQNSYFYVLADGGWGRDGAATVKTNYTYFGTGLGLAFETKAGIFNLAWAVGKRNDTNLNLRQSKIHFGFVNYF